LVSRGAIAKTEAEYKATVVRLLGEMRLDGIVPWSWIADNSRWQRVPTTYDSPRQLLEDAARTYRRDLWRSQPTYVEVWLEKDALSGVLFPITSGFGVPLMVSKGYLEESARGLPTLGELGATPKAFRFSSNAPFRTLRTKLFAKFNCRPKLGFSMRA